MENHRPTTTVDRSGRPTLVLRSALEAHAPTALTVAGASLLASLFVPLGLAIVIEWSWLVGIALVGVAVVTATLGLLGLHRRTATGSPGLALSGAMFATAAGLGGLVVLALSGLTGAAMQLPSLAFSVGKQAFVVLSLTMAGGYGLGFLSFGIGNLRSDTGHGREGQLLTAGGVLMLLPVGGGVLQLGYGFDLPAWVVFLSIGLVAIDTITVGISLRSTR